MKMIHVKCFFRILFGLIMCVTQLHGDNIYDKVIAKLYFTNAVSTISPELAYKFVELLEKTTYIKNECKNMYTLLNYKLRNTASKTAFNHAWLTFYMDKAKEEEKKWANYRKNITAQLSTPQKKVRPFTVEDVSKFTWKNIDEKFKEFCDSLTKDDFVFQCDDPLKTKTEKEWCEQRSSEEIADLKQYVDNYRSSPEVAKYESAFCSKGIAGGVINAAIKKMKYELLSDLKK